MRRARTIQQRCGKPTLPSLKLRRRDDDTPVMEIVAATRRRWADRVSSA